MFRDGPLTGHGRGVVVRCAFSPDSKVLGRRNYGQSMSHAARKAKGSDPIL